MGRSLILCTILVFAVLPAATVEAQDYATPVAPTFSGSLRPQAGHYISKPFTWDESDAQAFVQIYDLNKDGIPDQVYLDFDDLPNGPNFPWTHMTLGAAHGLGDNLEPGGYQKAERSHIFDGGKGPIYDMGHNHTGCDDVGQFNLSKFEWERKNLGFTAENPIWVFHAIAVEFEAIASCNSYAAPKVEVKVSYVDTPKGGDADPGDGGDGDGGDDEPEPPPPPAFQVILPSDLATSPLEIPNSGSVSFPISTAIDSTFNSELSLTALANAPEWADLDVEITPSVIAAPGSGEATLTIRTGPLTRPRPYIVTVYATTPDQVSGISFIVNVQCTPPFILGVDQPKSVAGVASGTQTTLEVKPGGSGPFFYQWYRGMPGMTNSPVQAENNARLVLTARESGPYWVRVRNACGSVDSSAALVTVATQPLSARRGARP